MDYQGPVESTVTILLQKVQTTFTVHTACYSTGTGLCLELNRAGVGRAVNWYRFVLGIGYGRAGVGRAVNHSPSTGF
jgi:hypothetical protein